MTPEADSTIEDQRRDFRPARRVRRSIQRLRNDPLFEAVLGLAALACMLILKGLLS